MIIMGCICGHTGTLSGSQRQALLGKDGKQTLGPFVCAGMVGSDFFLIDTVDGRNPANQLIGRGFIHTRWCRISSINSMSPGRPRPNKGWLFWMIHMIHVNNSLPPWGKV